MGWERGTGGVVGSLRPPAPDDADAEFWSASLRTANVLNGAILAINLAYFAATWSTRSNRPLLFLVTALGVVGLVGGLLAGSTGKALAASSYRQPVFQLWAIAGVGLIVFGVVLDGGLTSPMVWLFPLGILFCALVHTPRLVMEQAATTVLAFVAVAVADGAFSDRPAAVSLHIAYLCAVGALGSRAAAARWRYHRQLVELATHVAAMADRDPLTGLANHRVFHERLREELAAAARSGEPVALLLVDLDRFKLVNDEHGHLVGDATLRAVADVLGAVARESDVVAARVGGEEFGVVLRATGADGAAAVAERIREGVAGIIDPVPVTVSVGVGVFPDHGTTAEELYELADRAMYRAKDAGRNRVHAA